MKTLQTLILTIALAIAIPAPWATAQIFVTTRGNDTREVIVVAALDGGDPTVLIDMDTVFGSRSYHIGGIAVSGGDLFWSLNGSTSIIYTSKLDGSDLRVLIDVREIGGRLANQLLVHEDQLYWWDLAREALYTAGIDGSNPRELIVPRRVFGARPNGYNPTGLIASDSQLYWLDYETDAIYTMGLDGSNPRVLFHLTALFGTGVDYGPTGLAISGSRLFISNSHRLDGNPAIYAVDLDGENPTKLIDLDGTIVSLAVFESQIYWADYARHAVYTAGLDGSNPRKLFDSPVTQPEFIAIAPPPDSSPPQLKIRAATELHWESQPGVSYLVQRSSDGEMWLDDSSLIAGTGSPVSVLRPIDSAWQHYRVTALASLMGESINGSGAAITSSSATIDSEIEFQGVFGSLFFDFDHSQLTITQNPDQPTGGWSNAGANVFSGFDATIVDVSIAENEGFEGAIIENFSFTEHSINFDFDPLTQAGTRLVFDIQTAADSPEDALVSSLEKLSAVELHWDSRIDVSYQVHHSADLNTWFDDGAAILGSGSEMSALRPLDSERGYYRLALPGSTIGAVTRLETGIPLVASFETSPTGSTSGDGDGGTADNLPWSLIGDRGVALESTLPNPPASPGRCLLANSGSLLVRSDLRFRSQKVDIHAVPNGDVTVRVDLRTYESSSTSDW
jgi:hypothetical protein